MKIIIAPDSFKESLSAIEAANAIASGVKLACPDADIHCIPMADGGEGTVLAIAQNTHSELIQSRITNALDSPVQAQWALIKDSQTAVIEMASAAGLEQISPAERDIFHASTYGVGLLILEALNHNVRHIILGLGGSATNDGGAGMAAALGVRFLNKNRQELAPNPAGLLHLDSIDLSGLDKRLAHITFTLASDVGNPLCGNNGASAIFGPQKGASAEQVKLLDKTLGHYAAHVSATLGKNYSHEPGSGAAGGLGFGAMAFLQAQFRSGVEIVSEFTGLAQLMQNATLVFTGEGKFDAQTLQGKTLAGIASLAQKHQVPVIVIAGALGDNYQALYSKGITAAFSLSNGPMTLQDSMANTAQLLSDRSQDIMRTFLAKR
ncbi:MAG: glycerate kinase [Alcaligenaceae bacterium]|nr:glycerate kinase [Alcaligenaceae bacterium]